MLCACTASRWRYEFQVQQCNVCCYYKTAALFYLIPPAFRLLQGAPPTICITKRRIFIAGTYHCTPVCHNQNSRINEAMVISSNTITCVKKLTIVQCRQRPPGVRCNCRELCYGEYGCYVCTETVFELLANVTVNQP